MASLALSGTASSADRIDGMSYNQLAKAANKAIANGAIYGTGHGQASRYLKSLCYEMIQRAFSPYGTQEWARHVIRRESDCNPAAINHTYRGWSNQANGLAQMIPKYHTWVNYSRVHRDMKYAVAVFLRLSKGGKNTQPWCLCR